MPSRAEIRRVRRVLYDRDRVQRLRDHMRSIELLMNLDPDQPLDPDDPRGAPGSGPTWFIPATGELSSAVLESADRCDAIAGLLLRTRQELAEVRFDRSDKARLREALREQARAWTARGLLWRDPGRPDPTEAADTIVGYEARSLQLLKRVDRYFKGVDLR